MIGIDCPPSVKDELQKILHSHDIFSFVDLCSKKETEVMSIEELTPYMRQKIKTFLNHYGLKFGMTKKEIGEYKDYDYYQRHPEEKSLVDGDDEVEKEDVFEKDLLSHISSDKQEEMENVERVIIDDNGMPVSEEKPDSSDLQAQEAYARKRLDELDRLLLFNYDPLVCLKADEWEITLHSAAIRFMCYDSWFTKLFVSEDKRLIRAFKNAKKLYDMLRKEASQRSDEMRVLNEKYKKEHGELRSKFPDLFKTSFYR